METGIVVKKNIACEGDDATYTTMTSESIILSVQIEFWTLNVKPH